MLNNHSYYSLRFGTIAPEQLLQLAAQNGYETAVLTDINCTAGVIDFVRLAPKYALKPVVGIDFRNGAHQCYVGIAKNNNGYRNLCEHLSQHLHTEQPFGLRAPQMDDVYIIYPFEASRVSEFPIKSAGDLQDYERIGIPVRDVGRIGFSYWKNYTDKLVVLQTTTFRNKHDFNAHRLLRAIANNTLLSKLPKSEEGDLRDIMFSEKELYMEFQSFPEIVEQSKSILENCSVDLEIGSSHRNQKRYTESEDEDNRLIELLAREGLMYRYGIDINQNHTEQNKIIVDRLHKELRMIREKGFVAYYLINWDIVNYARSRGYFYVGRGSGANSLIAYLLRITDVDPIELDLYFERFINLFRQNPPDFDIDFSWKDREDITRYIFNRFNNVALLGAFVTFQYSAVVRELGKVFGLPKHDIDMLSDRKFNMNDLDSMHKLVLYYSQYLHEFPNYISIHAAGVLITEEPLHSYSATFLPPKGFPTVQFDMNQAEDIGINKLDILSQRGLGKIKDTLEIIAYNRPDALSFDIHDIKRFKNDERCNDLLRRAQAIGCFYVESPAMRMLLTKLQTHTYIGLVAASSVIRPGVASSGMMRAFILRERIPEKRNEAPKPLLDLMPETYGVMVYQEDVIKVAHDFAGLSLGEADVLRRGMSGKFRGREEFDRARIKFLEGAVQNGHSNELANEVWRQVESFAGYAFAKGHSASYAVESYQCLFLKAYFPLEYMVATINNYGGFYSTEIYVHEARMHGAIIEGPCVNRSFNETVLAGEVIYLGLQFIKSLEENARERILNARKSGVFLSLDDFLNRVQISLEQCVLLARSNAFRFTGFPKKEILWQLHFKLGKAEKVTEMLRLFYPERSNYKLPSLTHHWLEDAYDELELIGFPLCNPFSLIDEESLRDNIARQHMPGECVDVVANDFMKHVGKEIICIGYKVTLKPTRTRNGESMYFGTFLDRNGHFIDTVHFPPVASQFPISGWGLFLIRGRVCEEFDALSIEVTMIKKLDMLPDPRRDDQIGRKIIPEKATSNDRWMNRYFQHKQKEG